MRPRLCWILRRPAIPLTFALFMIITISTHPNIRQAVYEKAYGYPRIWWKSWQKPWQGFPLNEPLYQGRHDCPSDACARLPEPAIGSFEAIGLRSRNCMDRMQRLGPYGLDIGDNDRKGGFKKDRTTRDWADNDLTTLPRNSAPPTQSLNGRSEDDATARAPPTPRTAVVLRAWDGTEWTQDDLYNIRALVAESALGADPALEVFILLHVHSVVEALPKQQEQLDEMKLRLVPLALANMTELWNYVDCESAYPAVGEYDFYYHMFMSLQLFAQRHPEYDFIWNWEVDVRYIGNYHDLFTGLAHWSRDQKVAGLWERNLRFYIPSFHGSYEDFAQKSAPSVGGKGQGGGEADLVTLFPMFDVANTLWPHKNYLVNYSPQDTLRMEPRYGTVGTNMRFSKKLLQLMHEENLAGRAMMTEMWPTTLAFHKGLKAVYAPQPVYLDRQWPSQALQETFNAGIDGQVGGSLNTVINQEDRFNGSTWFWDSEFGLDLYRRWRGLVADGPGSPEWEEQHGMMCLPNILLHPVKASHLQP